MAWTWFFNNFNARWFSGGDWNLAVRVNIWPVNLSFHQTNRLLMNLPDLIDQIKSQPRLVIRFHASWCGVCKLLAPHVNRLKEDPAFADVVFIDVDVEEHLDVKEAFKINDLPYFAGFKDGKLIEEFSTAKKDKVTELAQQAAA